uniref:Uncharacterized protein n=1 Tax=Anguilla anguilla TaxID=7936 RepID=A0A0E9UVR4_ANGAN
MLNRSVIKKKFTKFAVFLRTR